MYVKLTLINNKALLYTDLPTVNVKQYWFNSGLLNSCTCGCSYTF